MTTVISIENLSKQYRLGVIGHGTLSQDLQSWWAKMRGKEDPNLKIAPFLKGQERQIEGNRFWALRDINLNIREGQVLGIIGKNGAGKSTLLKILSRVTAPTAGSIKIKGRIASLLEVGTGFHKELTGRENIFLNGAVLGMSKKEVRSKLDEIISFSEIGDFIDTPVKRYSSGMLVRLAFAVAAHLEPEILIVDEVLAVGDADFQKKCLGKMNEVSSSGRTVVFVSHNMQAVRRLCPQSILLREGQVVEHGDTPMVIDRYLSHASILQFNTNISRAADSGLTKDFEIDRVELRSQEGELTSSICFDETYIVRIYYKVRKQGKYHMSLKFRTTYDMLLGATTSKRSMEPLDCAEGEICYTDIVIRNSFVPGKYFMDVLVKQRGEKVEFLEGMILDVRKVSRNIKSIPGWGFVRLDAQWSQSGIP